MLSPVEKLNRLRADIDAGLRSLDAGKGSPLDIEQFSGREVANAVVRAIGDTSGMLEEYPLAGRERNEIRRGLRSVLRSPHVIFYRVRANVPEIVRVLDGRRDIDEIFSAESQQD